MLWHPQYLVTVLTNISLGYSPLQREPLLKNLERDLVFEPANLRMNKILSIQS